MKPFDGITKRLDATQDEAAETMLAVRTAAGAVTAVALLVGVAAAVVLLVTITKGVSR